MHEELKTMDEKQLREYKVGFPNSMEEVEDLVNALIEREHEYGTCVYAASIAGTAMMNYVASRLGMSGFQFSCADMDVIRRTRHMERFMIVDLKNHLYPQYDLPARVQEAIDDGKDYYREEARKLLDEADDDYLNEDVKAHWEKLANG
jgi:hypothetical protein